jgi:hypothetical protein
MMPFFETVIKVGVILRCVLRLLTSKIIEWLECRKIRNGNYKVAGHCNVIGYRIPQVLRFGGRNMTHVVTH